MKTIKLIFVSFFATMCCVVATAQIKFMEGDFKKALSEAKTQKKMLFVDFYTVWCQPCKVMDTKVFSIPHIGDYFDKNFIALKLDAEKPENADLIKKFAISSYPMMIFFDAEGKELKRIKSAMQPELFMQEVQSIGGDELSLDQMYAQYRKDKKDFDIQQKILLFAPMLIQKVTGYERDKWVARIDALFLEYVKNKGLNNMINESDFMIFMTFHTQTSKDDVILPHLGKNYEKYKEVVKEELLSTYIVGLNNNYIVALSKRGNMEYKKALLRINEDFKSAYSNMDFVNITPYQAFCFLADGTYYLYKQKDNAKFIQTMDDYFLALGNGISINDYTQAIEDIYSVNQGNLKENEYIKVIEWINKALPLPMATQLKVRLMIIMGDSNKKLGKNELFRQNLNVAYLLSAEITDPQLKAQLQQTIKAKLEEL